MNGDHCPEPAPGAGAAFAVSLACFGRRAVLEVSKLALIVYLIAPNGFCSRLRAFV